MLKNMSGVSSKMKSSIKNIEILNPQERIRLYDTAGIDENTKVCLYMNNGHVKMKVFS